MLQSIVSKRSSRSSSCRFGATRSVVEAVEPRLLMAVNAWKAAVDGNWSDPTKWSLGHVPVSDYSLAEDVVINQAGAYTVTFDVSSKARNFTIGGANSTPALRGTGKDFYVSGAFNIASGAVVDFYYSTLQLSGTDNAIDGTLRHAVVQLSDPYAEEPIFGAIGGTGRIENVEISDGGPLGPGLKLAGNINLNYVQNQATILIGPGAELKMFGSTNEGTIILAGGTMYASTLTNRGEILVGSNSVAKFVQGKNISNITVAGGRLVLPYDYINSGTLGVTLGGEVAGVSRGVIEWGNPAEPGVPTLGGNLLIEIADNYVPAASTTSIDVVKYQTKTGAFSLIQTVDLRKLIKNISVNANAITAEFTVLPYGKLANGILDVTGTENGDNISIHDANGTTTVTRNGQALSFTTSSISTIRVYANGGDDVVTYDGTLRTSLFGGRGNDFLRGGSGADTLDGEFGNDTLAGGKGNDRYEIHGENSQTPPAAEINTVVELPGEGVDRLSFTTVMTGSLVVNLTSDTALATHPGRTVRTGGAGQAANFEEVDGSPLSDSILGNAAANYLNGNALNDTLDGGDGNDYLSGGDGQDVLQGWNGNDTLRGGDGFDNLQGYTGDDSLDGGLDGGILFGGSGNDIYRFTATINIYGQVRIKEEAGDGIDTLDFSAFATPLSLNLTTDLITTVGSNFKVTAQTPGAGANFENLTGGSGADTLVGNARNNILKGMGGNDVLDAGYGQNGADVFSGGAGSDTIDYSKKTAAVYVDFADADDGIPGEKDDVWGDNETILGSAAGDTIIAATNPNGAPVGYAVKFVGNAGNDYLVGGTGNDTLQGGAGLDRLVGNAGQDLLQGDADADTLLGGDGEKDTLDGGSGTDSLASSDAIDVKISIP